MTFDELAAQRDPLYQVTVPIGYFDTAILRDKRAAALDKWRDFDKAEQVRYRRDAALLKLTIRALRNRGERYYPRR